MIGGILMLAGVAMMAPQRRTGIVIDPALGDVLREVHKAPTLQPLPRDMRAMTNRIAGPLRIIQGDRR